MIKILALSDVILNPVIKVIHELYPYEFEVEFNYSEDIITSLLSFSEENLDKQDIIFVHSDQLFHLKEQEWQKSLCDIVENFAIRFKKIILVSNAFSSSFNSIPVKQSYGYNVDLFNIYYTCFSKLVEHSNIYLFDFLSISGQVGLDKFYNYNLGHLFQMPYSKPGVTLFALRLTEQIKWLFAEEKKAIIVDCDNTLWKGILGEDGIEGIVCDKNAEGIVHFDFQRFLKAKQKEGFLLCLCSKNNEIDVKEAFKKKEFPLKWNDFTLKKINWEDKISNIKNIATELNIGTDSFIFIDDNLFELNSVSEFLKGIACLHFNSDYRNFINLTNHFLFKRRQVLESDREKAAQYETEKIRKEEETKYENLEDFIKSLNIKMDTRLNDMSDINRLAQLTAKTNQFNFNKHAYSTDELKEFIKKNNRIYSLKVSDKYGDYGTVGLIIIELAGKNVIIDNYLISCRVLGKGIEEKFYTLVLEKLTNEKLQLKEIRFIETEKNLPAQKFFKLMTA